MTNWSRGPYRGKTLPFPKGQWRNVRQGLGPVPVFDLRFNQGGLNALPQNLTVNNTTVSPAFLYEGANASASNWTATVGTDATAAGSGGNFNQGIPVKDGAAVDPDSSRYYTTSNMLSVGTDDLVVEMVVFVPASVTGFPFIFTTQDGTRGITAFINSSGVIALQLDDTDTVNINSNTGLNGWYHLIWFMDRSGSGVCYTNGSRALPGAGTLSVASDSLDSTQDLVLAANAAGNARCPVHIAWMGLWHAPSWLASHINDDFASNRFARLIGLRESRLGLTPTTMSTTGASTVSIWNGSSHDTYTVGQNWIPVDFWNAGSETRWGVRRSGSGRLTYTLPNTLASPYTASNGIAYDGAKATGAQTFVALSDGGAAGDRAQSSVLSAGAVSLFVASTESGTAANISGGSTAADTWLDQTAIVATDDFRLYREGVQVGSTDISGTAPNDIDTVDIGSDVLGGSVVDDGVISRVRIFNTKAVPDTVSAFNDQFTEEF